MLNIRKTLRAVVVACVCFAQISVCQSMSMQELFDSVNAQSNVSSPAAIQGQTMNMYTGGSMFMRVPNRTYNLASFTPPSWNAGCGGIDLFAGGFSFINKEQFVAMLRNIGSNALGYGFKLAIQNLCPTCDNVMQALQATAQLINRQNIDSCEAAKGVVNAAIPDAWTRDKQNAAKNFGVDSNLFSDITDAWTGVMNNESRANETINQVSSSRPEVKDSMPVGNVVWKALKRIDGIDDEYRMIIMSMIGTTIFPTDGNMKIIARKEISVKDLVGGNLVDAEGRQTDNIGIPIWRCTETTECMSVTEGTVETESFKTMVRHKMDDIVDKIATRGNYSDPSGVMQFLNTTDIPIYKMIAATTSLNNTAMADSMVNRYQELIAAKYAEVYIERAVSDLRAALASYSSQAPAAMAQEMVGLRAQMEQLRQDSRQVLSVAYAQTVSTYNIGLEVAHVERAMSANLSQTLRSALNFGRSLH